MSAKYVTNAVTLDATRVRAPRLLRKKPSSAALSAALTGAIVLGCAAAEAADCLGLNQRSCSQHGYYIVVHCTTRSTAFMCAFWAVYKCSEALYVDFRSILVDPERRSHRYKRKVDQQSARTWPPYRHDNPAVLRCTTCSTDRIRTHYNAHKGCPSRPTVGTHWPRCRGAHGSTKERSLHDCCALCCPTQPNQAFCSSPWCTRAIGRRAATTDSEQRKYAAASRLRPAAMPPPSDRVTASRVVNV